MIQFHLPSKGLAWVGHRESPESPPTSNVWGIVYTRSHQRPDFRNSSSGNNSSGDWSQGRHIAFEFHSQSGCKILFL